MLLLCFSSISSNLTFFSSFGRNDITMSSEANLSESSSNSPTPHELDETQIRRLTLLLPLIFRLASRQGNLEDPTQNRPLRVILYNAATRTTIMIDRSGDYESLFPQMRRKSEFLPASKDSVEAMPRVVVTEEDTNCAICLEDYEVGDEAREMPCKHRFHSGCIEKWLGIHGLCPICRFSMVDGRHGDGDGGEITEGSDNEVSLYYADVGSESTRGSESSDPLSESQDGIVSAMDDPSTNQELLDFESRRSLMAPR